MRVLVAPDAFAGTLTARQAAEAIAAGWLRRSPTSEVDLCPMSDGGPGFVDVLHASLGGELSVVTVRGPFGEAVPASVLRVGEVAYVESAQACGRHLVGDGDVEDATSFGVGELLLAAAGAGATRLVVGLGGSGTNDGGAGMLAALGATASGPLDAGSRPLGGLTDVDLAPALAALAGVELVAASDVDNPLAGLFGATKTYGPQKGLAEDRLVAVDADLEHFAGRGRRRLAACAPRLAAMLGSTSRGRVQRQARSASADRTRRAAAAPPPHGARSGWRRQRRSRVPAAS